MTVKLPLLLPFTKKRPALEKFVDEALPLVAVNLEQFAATEVAPTVAKPTFVGWEK